MTKNYFEHPTWCPGCGNFAILNALKSVFKELNLNSWQTVVVGGIGCSGNIANWTKTYSVIGLHGRAIPLASGIKLSNPNLTVIINAGDGDTYGIGTNHLIHSIRRNDDLTLIVHNNQIYALTTGQVSPTSEKGMKTKTTPYGNPDNPINPIKIALSAGCKFIARGFAGDFINLKELIKQAILYKGFSLVDVLQPCITFDKKHSYEWYRKRIVYLNEKNHNSLDIYQAYKKADLFPEKIYIGVFYKVD